MRFCESEEVFELFSFLAKYWRKRTCTSPTRGAGGRGGGVQKCLLTNWKLVIYVEIQKFRNALLLINTWTRLHRKPTVDSVDKIVPACMCVFEQIELPAKLLDYILWSNKSNINEMCRCVSWVVCVCVCVCVCASMCVSEVCVYILHIHRWCVAMWSWRESNRNKTTSTACQQFMDTRRILNAFICVIWLKIQTSCYVSTFAT